MHKQRTFTFINKQGQPVEYTSKPYSLNLEKKFIELIGKDAWNKYLKTGNIELNIDVKKSAKDFPVLLQGPAFDDIDYNETPIDELAAVYFFFITFRKNVFIEQQTELNIQQLSKIAEAMKGLNTTQLESLPNMTGMNTDSGF